MIKVSFGELLGLLDLVIKAHPELVVEPDLETVKLAESLVSGMIEKATQHTVEERCEYPCKYCGAGDEIHHSYTCPTNLHPDKRTS